MSHADEVMKKQLPDMSANELEAMILALEWEKSAGELDVDEMLTLIRAERDRKRQIVEEEYRKSAK